MELSETLNKFIIELGKATTKRETNYILNNHQVLVNVKKIKDRAYPVGLFDLVSFPEIDEKYTLIMNKLGKLQIIKIGSKVNSKVVSISGKKKIRGNKLQVFTSCGRTLLLDEKFDKEYSVKDSLRIELPSQKIISHFKFEKGSIVFLFTGSHKGLTAVIQKIDNGRVFCKFKDEEFEISNKSFIVIDKDMEKILQTKD